jgi:hypothetical protein
MGKHTSLICPYIRDENVYDISTSTKATLWKESDGFVKLMTSKIAAFFAAAVDAVNAIVIDVAAAAVPKYVAVAVTIVVVDVLL